MNPAIERQQLEEILTDLLVEIECADPRDLPPPREDARMWADINKVAERLDHLEAQADAQRFHDMMRPFARRLF